MAERPAVNASPLIYLSRAGFLDLLKVAANEIVVPVAVAEDVQRRGPTDPTALALQNATWLVITNTPAIPSLIQAWGLGEGESSVLAWAHAYPGTEAIIDDLAARRCAVALGIPLRGTLGIVLAAKMHGLIPLARPVLEKLKESGMYLSDHTLNRALSFIGE